MDAEEIIKQVADVQGNSQRFIWGLFNEYLKDRNLQNEIRVEKGDQQINTN